MIIHITGLFIVFLLFLRQSTGSTTFEENCLDLRNEETKSTYIDGACLMVEATQFLTRADAQLRCEDHGQLAAIFDQNKLSQIGSMLDLSNGVWTSLLLDSNNQTVSWLNKKTGKNCSVASPSWASGFPDPAKGAGVLLRFDGLVNTELESEHPFLCESFETSPQLVRFKGGSNSVSGEAVLSTSDVISMHQCGINCAEDPQCRAYAYSSSNGECQLLWLNQDPTTLEEGGDYKYMNRLHSEADCVTANDCLTGTELPKVLLVTNGVMLGFESYYPGQSSLNKLLYNTTSQKMYHIGVLVDRKVVITGHFHNQDSGQLDLAKETIVYDPSTNTVSSGGPSQAARQEPAAEALNQAVVMCGGISSTGTALTSCESYSNGQWTTMTAALTTGRAGFRMVNLHNKLYAIGGIDGSFLSNFECFDPSTNVWDALSPMPITRYAPGATVFKDRIVVCGGMTMTDMGPAATDLCDTYNDRNDQWSTMTAMATPRLMLVLVPFHGYIYALGAADGDGSVEKFDPQTGQWSDQSHTIQPEFAAGFVI